MLAPGDRLPAILILALAALALLILIGPVVVVIVTSFTTSQALRFPPPGLTFRWYQELFDPVRSAQIHRAAGNSLLVAITVAAFSTGLATAAALGIARSGARWARAAEGTFLAPLVLPGIAYGLATLMFFSWLRLPPSFWLLVAGHAMIATPFALRTVGASAAGLDGSLLDASAALGASPWRTFHKVILPLITPGVAAGAFLAFISSLDNVPVSLFLGSASNDMLPIRLWGMMETSLDVRVAAASGVLVAVAFLLLLVMDRMVGLVRKMAG
ncbi:ABC transporter permease [Muricoccus pecuniae]|uniref:Putative spermidine/putrescine transport system permease protein n=1 Tax=Muricoccus pecuniae TaxID=693023 RepID=A0A840YMN2_9PROT|nr:ABC transporter permease [Roseomonas pecuniae]MBB5696323.1 putative spermidine/putrescine transport system permease protein [Roseomonas pecuniae]